MKVWKPESSYAAKKVDLWGVLCAEVDGLASLRDIELWWTDFQINRLRDLPPVFQAPLRERMDDRRSELVALAQARSLDRQFARAMDSD
jgi:hypothetical protein